MLASGSVRFVQFLNCSVTSLTPPQMPWFNYRAAEVPHVARATSHAPCLGYMLHIRLFQSRSVHKKPSLCRLRLHSEESGIVFTLLRSGHARQHQRNGTIPLRIPPVNAPATALPARPPVCSAPHFPLAPLTGSTVNKASVLLSLRSMRTLAIHISKKIIQINK